MQAAAKVPTKARSKRGAHIVRQMSELCALDAEELHPPSSAGGSNASTQYDTPASKRAKLDDAPDAAHDSVASGVDLPVWAERGAQFSRCSFFALAGGESTQRRAGFENVLARGAPENDEHRIGSGWSSRRFASRGDRSPPPRLRRGPAHALALALALALLSARRGSRR